MERWDSKGYERRHKGGEVGLRGGGIRGTSGKGGGTEGGYERRHKGGEVEQQRVLEET